MRVSVVIPCYNAEQFLRQAVASVLSQTYKNIECIIVDDASTDASRDIITALARTDDRLVPIFLGHNSGPSVARNNGIENATGDWITLLDADDLYAADRIEKLVSAARTYPCDMIIDNQSVRTFPDGPHLFSGFSFLPSGSVISLTPELFFREDSRVDGFLRPGYMKPMISRSWLSATGLRFDPSVRVGEDFLFYANLLAEGARCRGLGYDGYLYRRRPTSLSRSAFSNLRSMAIMTEEFKAENLERLSKSSQRSLDRKSAYLRRFADLMEARAAINRREPLAATRIALRSPNVALALAQVLRRNLLRTIRLQP
jgi:succinoglycan biosynthesis protein ExoO